jgi:hypothetical protein
VKKNYINKLIAIFILFNISVKSQISFNKVDSLTIYKNEIGIDIANIITFLKKNNQSYLINYKYYFTNKSAFRGGLNLDWSTLNSLGKYVNTRIGYEYIKQKDNWGLYYGADFSYMYSKNNLQSIKTNKIGIEPLIGVKYFFSKHFSISTEAKINFYNYFFRDPYSFDPSSNQNDYRIVIGSVGMLLLNYHF